MVQLADKVPEPYAPAGRIEVLDLARGVALFAMATYHFTWDLEFFGYIPAGSTGDGWLKIYARLIAGSFLFLAGVSLALAHGSGLRAKAFLKRLAVIVIAAAAISIATYLATPGSFIFFGILHAIALSSIIGLLFLPLPGVVAMVAGIICIGLPQLYRDDLFNSMWLYWIGLHTIPPRSNDFVPLAPWLGPFLIGLGLTKLAAKRGVVRSAAAVDTSQGALSRALRFCGRHSLAVYLVHQPVLLVLVWTYSQVQPANPADPVSAFVAECRAGCEATSETAFCERFCMCVTDDLLSQGLFNGFADGSITIESDDRIPAIAEQCTVQAQP